eukprot:TRINITY_DN16067_c0_g1_i3.p2 TRINITY_DN16067_c0_g1~~TRINITY_DN16067_c0_g1_i3.p2  ORF type:complete len:126 (+),score=19.51 TRINITY_DN16067_c0_g1_i3:200-577(+)
MRKEIKSALGTHDRNSVGMNRTFVKVKKCEEPKVYKGAFNLPCVSMKTSAELMKEVNKGLSLHNIQYKKKREHLLNCQRQSVKFEIEVMQMKDIESMHIIRLKRLEGNVVDYKTMCSRLLSSMRL